MATGAGIPLPAQATTGCTMDGSSFDGLTRSLATGLSRRNLAGRLAGLSAAAPLAWFGSPETAARKKGKKKKKSCKSCPICQTCRKGRCQARPDGTDCGAGQVCQEGICACPGDGEACGTECCGACQQCDDARSICVMAPGSDETACEGGACCGGACCPPACQCGVPGANEAFIEWLAESQGLPYPVCVAPGTGQSCGIGGSACPANTTCEPFGSTGFAVCIGRCPGVDYPALQGE
jgi:hypothetical protein